MWGKNRWMISSVGPRFQPTFQRKAWTLEGGRENHIVLWEKGGDGGEEDKAEKEEETEKVPDGEGVQNLESEQDEVTGKEWRTAERLARSLISEYLRLLQKCKSQPESVEIKEETRPSLRSDMLYRRGKLTWRGAGSAQGSSQNLIRLPQPKDIVVKRTNMWRIWEIPFQGLRCVNKKVWAASQLLEACRIYSKWQRPKANCTLKGISITTCQSAVFLLTIHPRPSHHFPYL